jgi:hypothetical protein
MNEILQKRIVEAAKDYSDHNYVDEGVEVPAFIEGADSALKNQWISVEEALPTERDKEDEQYSTNVFARTKDCIRYAYYDFYNESWCSVEGGYRFGGDVTHWMSVPGLEGGEE